MATTDDVTAADVLADPGEYTVEQVLAAFAESSPEQVAEAQALEAADKNRKGIADYAPPAPEPIDEEPRYPRERVLDPAEAELISGYSWPVLCGALEGDDGTHFTREELAEKVEAFLTRPVHTEEG